MKSILLSVHPEWIAKIFNGKKTIAIRKKFPKDYAGWVYIYCTKDYDQLVKPKDYDKYLLFTKGAVNYSHEQTLNSKVVARFWCDNVEEIEPLSKDFSKIPEAIKNTISLAGLTLFACYNYTNVNYNGDPIDKPFYAIHISKLEVFDEPKELRNFNHIKKPSCESCPFYCDADCDYHREVDCDDIPLTKAPKIYCYVEVLENDK